MDQVFIVRHGDPYERYIVAVARSLEEARRLADEDAERHPDHAEYGYYGYVAVPVGQHIDYEGHEVGLWEEEEAAA